MSARGEHFTAVIEVNRVLEPTEESLDQYGKVRERGKPREVAEVARLVLRASDVEALKVKIANHVALIEET